MEAGEIGVDIVGLRVTVKVGWSLPSIGRFGAPVMLGCNSFFILDSFKETLHCSFFYLNLCGIFRVRLCNGR